MLNNRRFIPAWLVKASAWFLRQPGSIDMLVLVAAMLLVYLGSVL